MHRVAQLLFAGAALTLTACGGGGSNGSGEPYGPVVATLVAAIDQPDHWAVYGYDAQGHCVRRVSGPLGDGWGVSDLRWSPDRSLLTFVDDKDGPDREQVFLADPQSDADPIPLTTLPATPGPVYVGTVEWSPDGSHLLIYGNLDQGAQASMWVMPSTGGTPTRVSDGQWIIGYSTWFWSPDGQYVTWMESETNNSPLRQMVAKADGSTLVDVSGPMVAGGGVRMYQGISPWAPDSSRLVFIADKEVDEREDLYTVTPSGAGLVKLSTDLGPTEDCWRYVWSGSSGNVAFTEGHGGTNMRLVFAPAAGGGLSTLSAAGEYVEKILWQPGGPRIAWDSYVAADQKNYLRSTVPGFPGTAEHFASANAQEDIDEDWSWSPEGSRIAFRAGEIDAASGDHLRQYVADVANPGVVHDLIPSVTATGNARGYVRWWLDGSRLLTSARTTDTAAEQVWSCAADGSGSVQLSNTSSDQDGLSSWDRTSDGATAVWIQGYDGPYQVLKVGDASGGAAHKAEGPGYDMWYVIAR
jgi:Tol biopolymer transport system component